MQIEVLHHKIKNNNNGVRFHVSWKRIFLACFLITPIDFEDLKLINKQQERKHLHAPVKGCLHDVALDWVGVIDPDNNTPTHHNENNLRGGAPYCLLLVTVYTYKFRLPVKQITD